MNDKVFTLPNVISLGRLASLPLLWWLACEGQASWVGVGVVLAYLSDVLDGQLARRLNQVTRLGSKLDSLADNLLITSVLCWLPMLRPELFQGSYRVTSIGTLALYGAFLATGYLRFRRIGNLHLYSGKAAGAIGSIFVIDCLTFGFHPITYYLAVAALGLANTEGLVLLLSRAEVNEHTGSIFRRRAPAS